MSPAFGMHSTISRAEYDELTDFLNLSLLKKMAVAPRLFQHAREGQRQPDSSELKFGRLEHIAVFEPDRLTSDVVVWDKKVKPKKVKEGEEPPPPSDKVAPRNGNEWEAFQKEHAGKEIVTQEELDTALGMRDAVNADPRARELITGGSAEATIIWSIDGHNLKVRLDYINRVAITDLKSARCAQRKEFFWQAFKLNYHVQAAWTHDAVLVTTGESIPFWDLVVEKTPPYLVAPYKFPDYMIEKGRETYRGWLEMVARCRDAGEWPGLEGGEMEFPRGARVDMPYEEPTP